MQNKSLFLFKLILQTFNNFYSKRLHVYYLQYKTIPKKCLRIRNNSKTFANPSYRGNK